MTNSIEEARGRVVAILANCVEESEYGDDGELRMALEAIDALALAVHEEGCLDCRLRYQDMNERAWQNCPVRQVLGAKP
jgi:hypothetical protein